jgi:hypothetical protein
VLLPLGCKPYMPSGWRVLYPPPTASQARNATSYQRLLFLARSRWARNKSLKLTPPAAAALRLPL